LPAAHAFLSLLTSHSPSLTPHLAILSGLPALGVAVTSELATIIAFIRYGASRFSAAWLTFGHSHDNPIDEATHLVLASLHLPPDIPPAYGAGRLTAGERANVLALIERRVGERLPVAYLVGETWFAGLKFKSDRRALVPRSTSAISNVRWTCAPVRAASASRWPSTTRTGGSTSSTSATRRCRWRARTSCSSTSRAGSRRSAPTCLRA